MKIKTLIVLLYFLGHYSCLLAQEREFGDITIAELEAKQDTLFPNASAVILYRDIDFAFGNALRVHERIKIFSSQAFEYSDWTLHFDDVKGLKAATYNLVDGKIEKTKVSKAGIFKEKVSEYEEISKLTFPNIKEGAIIELKYKVTFIGMSTIYSQGYLPIKYERIKIYNGNYGSLSVRQNHYVKLPIRRINAAGEVTFVGENVPPLRKEKYITNVNNHRGKIFMQNHGNFYQQTWGSVAKSYTNASWFGEQLKKGDALYKKDLLELLNTIDDSLVMAKKIDRYVKDTITWDQSYSRGSEYVKTIFREKKGSSGDINLLLVHMLRSVGLQADPILVATKDMGWVMYPQMNAFNRVLATVLIDGKRYVLDGSQKNTAFGQIHLSYINDKGLIIFEDGSHQLYPIVLNTPSKETLIVNVGLDLNTLSVSGQVKKQITEYYALEHRDIFTDLKKETYEEVLNKIDLYSVSNVNVSHVKDTERPIQIAYDFKHEDYLEKIGSSIYFEPLLIWGLKENKFNEEDRLYPIDFEHPISKNYIINFTIPEGYKVESMLEPKLIKMEEDIGSLRFNIQQRGNQMQVLLAIDIKHYLIPATYYPALQALYSEFLQISKSKIVLSKIK